jgi:hypothetical protein
MAGFLVSDYSDQRIGGSREACGHHHEMDEGSAAAALLIRRERKVLRLQVIIHK